MKVFPFPFLHKFLYIFIASFRVSPTKLLSKTSWTFLHICWRFKMKASVSWQMTECPLGSAVPSFRPWDFVPALWAQVGLYNGGGPAWSPVCLCLTCHWTWAGHWAVLVEPRGGPLNHPSHWAALLLTAWQQQIQNQLPLYNTLHLSAHKTDVSTFLCWLSWRIDKF